MRQLIVPNEPKALAMTTSQKTVRASRVAHKTAKKTPDRKPLHSMKSANDLFFHVYQMAPHEFIREVKRGTPAKDIGVVAKALGLPDTRYIDMIGLIRSTFNRKVKSDAMLEPDQSERHMRVMRMIGQLTGLINEFGDPNGFDAAQWFGTWIEQPNPALGNAKPSEYLDTAMGAEIVEATLQRMFTGAYA